MPCWHLVEHRCLFLSYVLGRSMSGTQDLNALLKVTRPDGNSIPAYPALVSGAGDWDPKQVSASDKTLVLSL
eukprot:149918-Amphidinium_carterae.1